MSKKRRPGPQPLKGRARPIGPVMGLARAEEGIEESVKEQIIKEDNGWGQMVAVSTRRSLDHTRFSSRLLASVGGNISLSQINEGFTLTPAQRRPVRYLAGDVDFPDSRQVFADEQWEGLEKPGTLLVVSGSLIRMTNPGGVAKFNFEPLVWDIAQPDQHARGRLALPQDTLPAVETIADTL